MLKRIYTTQQRDDPIVVAYRRFMIEIVEKCDIGAQETYHMLQKLPLVVCNRPFTTLNVRWKVLHRLTKTQNETIVENSYFRSYMGHPPELEIVTLIESARSYTYVVSRK